jgi:hypothetical protein
MQKGLTSERLSKVNADTEQNTLVHPRGLVVREALAHEFTCGFKLVKKTWWSNPGALTRQPWGRCSRCRVRRTAAERGFARQAIVNSVDCEGFATPDIRI